MASRQGEFDPAKRFLKRKVQDQNITTQQFLLLQKQLLQSSSLNTPNDYNVPADVPVLQQQQFMSPPPTPTPVISSFSLPPISPSANSENESVNYDAMEDAYIAENLQIVQQLRQQNVGNSSINCNDDSEVASHPVSGEFNPEIFIELVRSYPCIWNAKLNVYRDTGKKKTAWGFINDALGGNFTSKKFLNLKQFVLFVRNMSCLAS